MEKAAKKERRLAEKRAKKEAKEGKKKEEDTSKLNIQEPITLDFITNPNKDKWIIKKTKAQCFRACFKKKFKKNKNFSKKNKF